MLSGAFSFSVFCAKQVRGGLILVNLRITGQRLVEVIVGRVIVHR